MVENTWTDDDLDWIRERKRMIERQQQQHHQQDHGGLQEEWETSQSDTDSEEDYQNWNDEDIKRWLRNDNAPKKTQKVVPPYLIEETDSEYDDEVLDEEEVLWQEYVDGMVLENDVRTKHPQMEDEDVEAWVKHTIQQKYYRDEEHVEEQRPPTYGAPEVNASANISIGMEQILSEQHRKQMRDEVVRCLDKMDKVAQSYGCEKFDIRDRLEGFQEQTRQNASAEETRIEVCLTREEEARQLRQEAWPCHNQYDDGGKEHRQEKPMMGCTSERDKGWADTESSTSMSDEDWSYQMSKD